MIHIREGVAGDAPWIAGALTEASHEGNVRHATEDRVAARLADPACVHYLAVVEGARVGFAAVTEAAPRLWEVRILVVTERRHGYGRALLRHLTDHVFDEFRAHRLYLEVTANNAGARALYEREGFVAEGRFRDGYAADDGTFRDLIPYGMLASDRKN